MMPKNVFTIAEIHEIIGLLPEQFEYEPEVVAITRDGKPIMAILSWKMQS